MEVTWLKNTHKQKHKVGGKKSSFNKLSNKWTTEKELKKKEYNFNDYGYIYSKTLTICWVLQQQQKNCMNVYQWEKNDCVCAFNVFIKHG